LQDTAALEFNDIGTYVQRLEKIILKEKLSLSTLAKSFKAVKGQVVNLYRRAENIKAISTAA